MEKRVFLIVLDSFGIGAEPDAAAFGDEGTNTLGAIAKHPNFNCPNLRRLGMFNIDGVTAGEKTDAPIGSYARLQEQSMGKDTTIGHWEIAGVVSPKPLPTFPEGGHKETGELLPVQGSSPAVFPADGAGCRRSRQTFDFCSCRKLSLDFVPKIRYNSNVPSES